MTISLVFQGVLHQLDTIRRELGGEVRYAISLKIEVEVLAFLNIRDGRVFLIDKLQVEDLIPSPDARVKISVVELDRESQLLGVEADG
jgi:hypothetical protein